MRPGVLVVAGLLLAAPALSQQPTLTFDGDRVVAKGVTPGGPVAWFSVANERGEWIDVLVRRQAESVADASGAATFALERAVPKLSVWAVVDLTTGELALASPARGGLREVPFPADALRASPSGEVPFLDDARGYLEVFLARPGEGAWGLTIGDGTELDADGAPDGRTKVAIGSLRPLVRGRASARSIAPGDVIVVVDPNTMETYAATVGGPKPPRT